MVDLGYISCPSFAYYWGIIPTHSSATGIDLDSHVYTM